jgi:hypothetical protein
MTGMTSKVSSHVLLEPRTAFKLGWALFRSGAKSWWTTFRTHFERDGGPRIP